MICDKFQTILSSVAANSNFKSKVASKISGRTQSQCQLSLEENGMMSYSFQAEQICSHYDTGVNQKHVHDDAITRLTRRTFLPPKKTSYRE
jgi:hypothetical protein